MEFLDKFRRSSVRKKAAMIKILERKEEKEFGIPEMKKNAQKQLKKVYQEELVKRSAINKIIVACLIPFLYLLFLVHFVFYAFRFFIRIFRWFM